MSFYNSHLKKRSFKSFSKWREKSWFLTMFAFLHLRIKNLGQIVCTHTHTHTHRHTFTYTDKHTLDFFVLRCVWIRNTQRQEMSERDWGLAISRSSIRRVLCDLHWAPKQHFTWLFLWRMREKMNIGKFSLKGVVAVVVVVVVAICTYCNLVA